MIIGQQKLEEIAITLIDGNPDSKEDKSFELPLPGLGELYIHYFGFRKYFGLKKIRSLLLRTKEQNIGITQYTAIGVKQFNNGPYDKPTNVFCAEAYDLQTKKIPHYNFPELIKGSFKHGEGLFVRPNFRSKGFGKGLFILNLATLREESRLYAEENGLEMMPVCLEVYIRDKGVIPYHEKKIGFKIEKTWESPFWKGRYFVPPQEIPPFVIKSI